MTENAAALIILVPLMASFINLVVGLRWKEVCYPLTVATLGATVLLSFSIIQTVISKGTITYEFAGWAPPWGIAYVIDHLNAFMLAIVSFIGLVVSVYSKKSIEKDLPKKTAHFYTLFLLLVAGLLGILATGDAFNLFVFLEISSLAGYALIAVGDDRAPLASFNYVIMGTIGACFYLLGVGYLYIATGSLNMADLAGLLPNLYGSKVVLGAFAFMIVGVAIKIAFFPLHKWLPDAYTHAPSAVSAFVSSTMTKVGAYVMIRIMFTVFEPQFSTEILPASAMLGWLAVAAMLYGCVRAIAQTDAKRMLSYIIIAEVGYIVMGVSVGNRMGFTGAVLHILNDAFMMACLFLAVGAVEYKTGTRSLNSFGNLYKKMPVTMAAITIGGLSIVGIPPTAGFFSKWYLVLGAIGAGQWVFAAALLISSLLTAVIFFKILVNIYFGPQPAADLQGNGAAVISEAPVSMLFPISIMAAGVLSLGFLSGKIISSVIQFTVPGGF
ncbi:MAG: monovalent cation/H+ antiporter subunit D family protein [Nitrospiraceae bacterium]|nr:MAG: monovalent cation/H+ antiporter subunit D family protein [Nitrospiraceae bacterium]